MQRPAKFTHALMLAGALLLPVCEASAVSLKGKLEMVLIHADSGQQVAELRRMAIDIVRVRPDPDRLSLAPSLERQPLLVEAVVPRGMVMKLRRLGFQVQTKTPAQPPLR